MAISVKTFCAAVVRWRECAIEFGASIEGHSAWQLFCGDFTDQQMCTATGKNIEYIRELKKK